MSTSQNAGSGSTVDTDAGASGSSPSSFDLSTGAMIAIIVVVVVVVVFGVVSTVLYVLAKRRQWDIRQSMSRFSRRVTGRPDKVEDVRDNRKAEARKSKREGIRLESQTRDAKPKVQSQKEHKPNLVVQVRDLEKGLPITPGKKGWKGNSFS